jgi:hypothetical protein
MQRPGAMPPFGKNMSMGRRTIKVYAFLYFLHSCDMSILNRSMIEKFDKPGRRFFFGKPMVLRKSIIWSSGGEFVDLKGKVGWW